MYPQSTGCLPSLTIPFLSAIDPATFFFKICFTFLMFLKCMFLNNIVYLLLLDMMLVNFRYDDLFFVTNNEVFSSFFTPIYIFP